uniref:TM2 domain-containing protein n=1 Tax=Dulem virus 40 TaxID=3145758 RepID=A0AAU8AW88_9CAUD
MATQNTGSALATALRVIGVLNIIGGVVYGYNACYKDALGLICFVIVGVIGCIICFALAKCVQAATVYLNSATPKDKPVKPWLKGTIFDEEPSEENKQN